MNLDVGIGVVEIGVERAVQQKVDVALQLVTNIARFRGLLADGQPLGLGTQHLILRDLAVAEQRFGDPQVFCEQSFAGLNDHGAAARSQPVEIADRHITLQSLRQGDSSKLVGFEQRSLCTQSGRQRRGIQGLTHADARVLLLHALLQ